MRNSVIQQESTTILQTNVPMSKQTQQQQYSMSRKYKQKKQALTRISMLPEDTEGKVLGPALDVKCKINTGTNVMLIPHLQKVVPNNF